MYMWFEEMGLINEPRETRKEKIQQFEEYLTSVAARNKLTRKDRHDTLRKRGKAV